MIFDLPWDVMMAIKIRAVKTGLTTGKVVEEAMRLAFPDDVRDAQETIRAEEALREAGSGD